MRRRVTIPHPVRVDKRSFLTLLTCPTCGATGHITLTRIPHPGRKRLFGCDACVAAREPAHA